MQDLTKLVESMNRQVIRDNLKSHLNALAYLQAGDERTAVRLLNRRARCQNLQMLEHDLKKHLRTIGGFAEILTEYSLPETVKSQAKTLVQQALDFDNTLEQAIYNPSILIEPKDSKTRFEHIYDRILTEIQPFSLQDHGPQEQEEISDAMRRIDNAQSSLQHLIYEHLDYGHNVGHFDLVDYLCSLHQNSPLRTRSPYRETDRLVLQGKYHLIIDNLVGNAIKAGATILDVAHTRSACGKKVDLHFTDNGSGIHDDHRQRIFEPYFSGFSKKSRSKVDKIEGSGEPKHGSNTGLGLSHARTIAEKYGGSLHLYSTRQGEGTTFVLSVPRERFFYKRS